MTGRLLETGAVEEAAAEEAATEDAAEEAVEEAVDEEAEEDEAGVLDGSEEDSGTLSGGSEEDSDVLLDSDTLEEGSSGTSFCFKSDTPMLTATMNISSARATMTMEDMGDFLAMRFFAIVLLHLIKFLSAVIKAFNANQYSTI